MSAKKKSSGKTSSKSKANRRRKPKVKLNSKSVLALAVAIIVMCVVFLAVSIYVGSDFNKAPETKNSVNTSQPAEKKEQKPAASVQETEKKQSATSENGKGSSVSTSQSSSSSTGKTTTPKTSKTSEKNTGTAVSAANSAVSNVASSITPSTPAPVIVEPEPPAAPKYNIPQAKNNAVICIVIDDAGQNINNLKRYTNLPFPITVALLPKLENSKACSWVVRSSGKELILHQPMQSLNLNLNPGPGKITPEMSTMEIAALVKENLDEVGPVKGMNNHEGSLITENVIKIGTVLEVCQERGIYFLDSRTTAQTKAPQAALERDMNIYERDVFIDDIISRDAMLEQIYRALAIANKNGKVIMIGHVDKSVNILPDLLMDMYPYLVEKGYKFATPSTL